MKRSHPPRLIVFDGIRGLAILVVFLGHIEIPYHFLPAPIPVWISLVVNETILGSGFLGVSMLFVLSGFLMMYLYPKPASSKAFIQKRYSRIFPLFVTVTFINLFLRTFPHIYFLQKLGILLVIPFLANFVWVHVVQKRKGFGDSIFISFFIVQISTMLFLFSFTGATFANSSFIMQKVILFLSTATLVWPLSGSIPILDTLYWTLGIEVFFYILYPTCIARIINASSFRSDSKKIVLLLVAIPFCYFLYFWTYEIQLIRYIQLHLLFHFLVGVALGYCLRNYRSNLEEVGELFVKRFYYLPLLILLCDFMLYHYLLDIYPSYKILIQLLSAVPLFFLFAVTISEKTILAKLFRLRFLRFIGTISYSMYLTHLMVFSLTYSVFFPTSSNKMMKAWEYSVLLILCSITTICVSSLFYYLMEKPYFAAKKIVSN